MIYFLIIFIIGLIVAAVISAKIEKERKELFSRALNLMKVNKSSLDELNYKSHYSITVKSRSTLEKYDSVLFIKNNRDFLDIISKYLSEKSKLRETIIEFLRENPLTNEKQYPYVRDMLRKYSAENVKYIVLVKYITSAGNYLAKKDINFTRETIGYLKRNPELYMTKTELKEIEKEKLDEKKKQTYSSVNSIIDSANQLKDNMIVKKDVAVLDNLIKNLFDRTVNSIQKIKSLDSEEWGMINNVIKSTQLEVNKIKDKNFRIKKYYDSNDFNKIKNTCETLMKSQREFNEYIEEKIESLSKLFGSRIVRNETTQEDTYNYVRKYKKTLSPFNAELSSTQFASAENNPIQYLIKQFYPNKSLYKEQICDLKNLLNELDTLKDAKQIIENYKKEYSEYIQNVPKYVLEEDEDGFYSRLGFAIIDENILNVEYKFSYTSGGGMAQRSFSIPMNEETIIELITQLQNKLSSAAIAKEQRNLMTPKLREFIKKRDKYTCCFCGNSTHVEPNLLLEIDHINPIANGGLTVEENLQTLCWKCNRSKGVKLI